MTVDPTIFKDYDIRAVVGEQLDNEGVHRIGQSIAQLFSPNTVAIGYDMRLSSIDWKNELADGLTSMGVNVIDLGLTATDMIYFASGTLDVDIAVQISASHNPPQFNGFKIVKRGAVGVSGNSGIYDIRDLVVSGVKFKESTAKGSISKENVLEDWVKHAASIVDTSSIKPLKVVIDAGNGMAGKVIPAIEKLLPIEIIPLYFELDGSFPNHLANPLLPTTWGDIKEAIEAEKADLGIMFDGDGDRMFLFDENGEFVSGTITTAMVAEQMLKKTPESIILYNAICGRIVPETIAKNNGKSKRVRVGHTLIKEAMRKYDGLFAGEHSGHYYFKENFYADSGLIAALVVLELMSEKNQTMSEIVAKYDVYPAISEMNFNVTDKKEMMDKLANKFGDAESIDWLDGVSIWYSDWWANIRPSNTQPVLRLNIEANNQNILKEKTEIIKDFIIENGGNVAADE